MSKDIIIDGSAFDDLEGFYDYIGAQLTDGSINSGHNLDAFNDLLRGGFGAHRYGEKLNIKWMDFERSREALGDRTMLNILAVILDGSDSHDCKLEIFE